MITYKRFLAASCAVGRVGWLIYCQFYSLVPLGMDLCQVSEVGIGINDAQWNNVRVIGEALAELCL